MWIRSSSRSWRFRGLGIDKKRGLGKRRFSLACNKQDEEEEDDISEQDDVKEEGRGGGRGTARSGWN